MLDPEVVARMVGRRRAGDTRDTLTAKEREVLELMAEGLSNRAIADRLVVTDRAVERDVTSIFGKLGLTPTGHGQRGVLAVLAYLKS